MLAARNGHLRILSLLAKYKANINAVDTSGNSAIHYASAYGFIECLEYLLKLGADPNLENVLKTNCLQIAVLKKNFTCVNMLLDKVKINVNALDEQGRTLLGLAIQSGFNKDLILKIITDHNIDPNLKDAEGNTPLLICI